eukprot:gene24522-26350_t
MPPAAPATTPEIVPLRFSDLAGWHLDDHALAMAAFLRSCRQMLESRPVTGSLGISGSDLQAVARRALATEFKRTAAGHIDPQAARLFFETWFRPAVVSSPDSLGFLTGYFEPEVEGALVPDQQFRYPLHARPPDLIDVDPAERPIGWDPGMIFARRIGGAPQPYFDRGEIEDGALAGQGLELVYLSDPIDAYIIHVQGSARIRLPDGSALRVAYAAKAGHPYTSIGAKLIERGKIPAERMTLAALRGWLAAHPDAARALMRENRSYVFFQVLDSSGLDPELGAIAAAGVQLTPGRSLAVDHRLYTYGTPVWIEARLPLADDGSDEDLCRLVIAQDTGSAIVGPARGDIFFGLGSAAEDLAGRIRHAAQSFVVLVPRDGAQ